MIRPPAALAVASLVALIHAVPARAEHQIRVPPEIAKLYQDKPVIELVTMGVGSLIWERHGHIALCVHYDDPRDDRCYNYGIGDFHHPLAMAWGFLRGAGSFWVGKSPVRDMLSNYEYADRTIWVQPLPLTPEQKKQVIDKLEFDILEPNRYYAYDHFWDNCTTRVRDILDDVTAHKLSGMTEPTDDRTYRDLAREGFFGMRLPLITTDLAMGRVTDRVPNYYERMFLPQYLREAVARLWGIQPIAVYERHGAPPQSDGPSGRVWFTLVILLLTSPSWITRRIGRLPRTGLALSVAPYVLLGTILTFLAIISPLPYMRWNESCLVLFPLDVLVLILPAGKRRGYARGRLAMLGGLAVLWLVGILKQPLWPLLLWPAIPLAVAGLWPVRQAVVAYAQPARAAKRAERP
ncbi:MAG TPA: DUF4105 domain-containing protein [Kofleriaceae bacterium]|nr:DUF4105 domain-containing protein [Kofleriaceae bacterium]